MKKIILAFTMMVVVFHTSGQTTEAEYNYVIREHAVLARNGLVKPGYDVVDLGHWGLLEPQEIRYFNFSGLVKSSARDRIIAVIIDYELKKSETDTAAIHKYYCIPHERSSEKVKKMAYDDFIRINDFKVYRAYCWALSKYMQHAFSNPD